MLQLIRADYPAKIGRIEGLVLLDFVGLAPEVHGDPNPEVLDTIDAAAMHERVALLARVRDTRPPPPESRSAMMDRLKSVQDKLACVAIALEGAGFRSVAFRSFISAARLIGVIKIPVEIRPTFAAAMADVVRWYPLDGTQRQTVEAFFTSADEASEARGE